ncbi:hypothetical protein RsS62_11310 [Rhizobium dioscoreae]|uniref:Uncharacterized protein n=1 Tax=Rhizobium dioscoreae TaxID=2653122 RepID=A0ABQ0Z0W2_9HYPH|nr:hypothetical protein RsS62_11310 [Rhizobium dioscoreae]GES49186.1 hypothetical protein RsS93_18000 [Rhizobium dioscoreae]GLU80628.1 hypothetical protein Rhsp01_18040 [Rhizobium sp. NBRC 114257]
MCPAHRLLGSDHDPTSWTAYATGILGEIISLPKGGVAILAACGDANPDFGR